MPNRNMCSIFWWVCCNLRQSKMFLGSLHSRNHMLFLVQKKGPIFTFSSVRYQNLTLPLPTPFTRRPQPSIKTSSNTKICRVGTKQPWGQIGKLYKWNFSNSHNLVYNAMALERSEFTALKNHGSSQRDRIPN